MKEQQFTKSIFKSAKASFNRKRIINQNITMRTGDRKAQKNILRKKPARVKAVSKAAMMKTEEKLPPDILRTCKGLKTICNKIERLEKTNTVLKREITSLKSKKKST